MLIAEQVKTFAFTRRPPPFTRHSFEPRINAVKRLAVSTSPLRRLLALHVSPIDLVVFQEPMFTRNGKPDLAEGFTLRCLQRLSRPYVGYPAMLLAEQLAHQRYVPPN